MEAIWSNHMRPFSVLRLSSCVGTTKREGRFIDSPSPHRFLTGLQPNANPSFKGFGITGSLCSRQDSEYGDKTEKHTGAHHIEDAPHGAVLTTIINGQEKANVDWKMYQMVDQAATIED